MKLLYVCECCDAVVDEVELPARPSGSVLAGLTGVEPQDIIKTGDGEDRVILITLCDDCRETLYGGPENTFFSGPVLH